MRSIKMYGLGVLALLCVGAVAEHLHFQTMKQTTIGSVDPQSIKLQPAPIHPAWILEGHPVTEAAEVAHTDDGSTKVYVWRTTAGKFNWFYDSDEVVTVLDGEVFVTDGSGPEHRIGPGDVAFFPAGARTTWRVPDHVRKIATLKSPMPGPVASVIRWMKTAKAFVKPTAAFAGD